MVRQTARRHRTVPTADDVVSVVGFARRAGYRSRYAAAAQPAGLSSCDDGIMLDLP
jgi:hypothetical protein